MNVNCIRLLGDDGSCSVNEVSTPRLASHCPHSLTLMATLRPCGRVECTKVKIVTLGVVVSGWRMEGSSKGRVSEISLRGRRSCSVRCALMKAILGGELMIDS